ncbi:MAG: aldehyde dehydrogenase family protein [Candidatus Cloacimonadales bacterium]|nr:aldehyde dehydrogenase family protein [Candidatus Cloacimonadales bacterium]
MKVINPANNEFVTDYKEHTSSEVPGKLQKAEIAFQAWKRTPFAYRADLITSIVFRQICRIIKRSR